MVTFVVACLVAATVLAWPARPRPTWPGVWRRTRSAEDRIPIAPTRRRTGRDGLVAALPRRLRSAAPARAEHRTESTEAALIAALGAMAPALKAGLPPGAALDLVVHTSDGAGLDRRLVAAARSGAALAPVWRQISHGRDAGAKRLVACAWELSERHGAALADCVALAVQQIREGRAWRRRVAVATAGPRATIRVLTALPVAGVGLAALFGVSPTALYLGSPLSTGAALTGVGLVVGGRAWCRRLTSGLARVSVVQRAAPPPRGRRRSPPGFGGGAAGDPEGQRAGDTYRPPP